MSTTFGYSDLVISVYLDLVVSMPICVTYEGSTINHTDRRGNYSEKEKRLSFKNIGNIDLIFHVHTLVAYMHTCAKYEVSIIMPVARKTVQRQCQMTMRITDNDCISSTVKPVS